MDRTQEQIGSFFIKFYVQIEGFDLSSRCSQSYFDPKKDSTSEQKPIKKTFEGLSVSNERGPLTDWEQNPYPGGYGFLLLVCRAIST